MHLPRHPFRGESAILFSALAISALVSLGAEQPSLTNAFPTNVFLTDENMLFSYRKGERLVRTQRVQEALRSNESRPAEQDPQGHWGKMVDGFQISLRFDKQEFTNGEPIVAAILMRNVSEKRLSYTTQMVSQQPSPVYVSVWRGDEKLKVSVDEHAPNLSSTRVVSLYPRTQHRYHIRLDKYYDLSKAGTYSAQAEYGPGAPPGPAEIRRGHEAITSQEFTISVTNAPPQ